jgi:arylsulfatase A-like enzyme
MHALHDAGYRTAMIGKHHYIDRYGVGMDVTLDNESVREYGFDYVFQVIDDGENQHNEDEYTHYLAEKGRLKEFRDGYRAGVAAYKHPFEPDETADGFIGRSGIDFVQSHDFTVPLYLNLSFIGPHPPYWHPGDLTVDPASVPPPLGAPDTEAVRVRRAHYLEKCSLIDRYVGSLVEAFKEKDAYEGTVFIFTSDHGDNLGDYGIYDKRYFYENCCGVPFFMAGPGIPAQERMNGSKICRALVSHLDLYPTILELAGLAYEPVRRRTGRSLLPMLRDVPGSLHCEVFSELATAVMIHTGNWKLVFDPEQGGVRYLFNLLNDPQETANLAGVPGYEHTTHRLVQRLLSDRIRRTQFTHVKEEQRLQSVRIGP